MLTNALLVLVVAVGGVLLYAATRPDTFRVERSVVINRTPADVFPLLDNFHNWVDWSPWEGLDPTMRRTYRGPDQGNGAIYEWEGNSRVGKGHMEITRTESPTHLTIDLRFVKPFKADNAAAFDLERRGDATDVTWAVYGPLPFPSKVMSIFVSMDKLLGKDFDRGLSRLKAAAEQQGRSVS